MNRLKLCLILIMFCGVVEVLSKCTASQSNKLTTCSVIFFDAIGFYKGGDSTNNALEVLLGLTYSWKNIEKLCIEFNELQECLGPAVIKNCMDLKKDVNSMSEYMDFGLSFLHLAGNYICNDGHQTMKNVFSCALSHCEIPDDTCQRTKKGIDKCLEIGEKNCDKMSYAIMNAMLTIRECFKNPDCDFCDDEIREKVRQVRAKMNAGKKDKEEIKKDYIPKDFTKAAQSKDVDLELDEITTLRKQLSGKKISKENAAKEEFLPLLTKFLSSENSNVQAEAIMTLKSLVDKTPETLEVIIYSEIIPALSHTLNSMDENVLESVLEILGTIISKQPKLRSLYMDLNIVEPMLMSYSPETSRKILHNMGQILAHLCRYTKAQHQLVIETLIPALSELANKYDSKKIVETAKNFVKAADKDDNFIFDAEVFHSIIELLEHSNEDVSNSALAALGYFYANTLGENYAEKLKGLTEGNAEQIFESFSEEEKENVISKLRFEL